MGAILHELKRKYFAMGYIKKGYLMQKGKHIVIIDSAGNEICLDQLLSG